MKIWEGYQKGINLGGWFSQCDHTEERYDRFVRAEDFARIRAWGADHVRIPVDYELLEDAQGEPREHGYVRLHEAVRLCRENGLHVVLDLHKTAGFSFDANEGESGFFDSRRYQERFYRLWERIAEHFAKDADLVAFELLNEVTKASYMEEWKRISLECVRRIRAIAPETWILLGGYDHNSAKAVKDLPAPPDERIIYNFHCYEPLIFTHQGAPWIETMDPEFRIRVDANYGELAAQTERLLGGSAAGLSDYPAGERLSEEFFERFLAEAVRTAEERGVRLYCGEYGVIDRADPEDALVWFEMIHRVFRRYGIGHAAWSYREMDFGLADARMDAVRERLLAAM
ncbi:MAG: cellulase family glycosylhydrolase [Lachnospiraceae bacterium]|nr:cellulase family glycosylhydrolase [Lachnospiraceae bacterium]